MYEMMTLKHAFNAKDMNSLVYKILRGKVRQVRCFNKALKEKNYKLGLTNNGLFGTNLKRIKK